MFGVPTGQRASPRTQAQAQTQQNPESTMLMREFVEGLIRLAHISFPRADIADAFHRSVGRPARVASPSVAHGMSCARKYDMTIRERAWMFWSARFSVDVPSIERFSAALRRVALSTKRHANLAVLAPHPWPEHASIRVASGQIRQQAEKVSDCNCGS